MSDEIPSEIPSQREKLESARERGLDTGTGGVPAQRVQKQRWSHDLIIDVILGTTRRLTRAEIGQQVGYTPEMIGIITNSDTFKVRLAERRHEARDPVIAAAFEKSLEDVSALAASNLLERLRSKEVKDRDLIAAVELSSRAKAYGAKVGPQKHVHFVVPLPNKAASGDEWAAAAKNGELAASAGGSVSEVNQSAPIDPNMDIGIDP